MESLQDIGVQEFRSQYLVGNIPCLIEDVGSHFDCLQQMWTKADGSIDVGWFRDNLPHDAWLPVSKRDESDIRMTIVEWLRLLATADGSSRSDYYLKDWHFLNWMYEYTDIAGYETHQPLYQVPRHFGFDFLNNYHLVQTRHMADYRFVYWGPAGSVTKPHTDVLLSLIHI